MVYDEDRLVYDSALGWIDPDDILGSLGITSETDASDPTHRIYRDLHGNTWRVPCHTDWDRLRAVLDAVIDDAERRDRESGNG